MAVQNSLETAVRPRGPTRQAKRTLVVETLRQEIVEGIHPRGAQLPPHLALARRFQVSPVTVQRALDRLAEEGFLHSRERAGTFVVEQTPHLTNYALVFAEDPKHVGRWSRFYAALMNESVLIERREPRKVFPFYGISGHTDTADYQRLVKLVRTHRVAGLIFVQGEHYVADTPLMTIPDMPRVALKSRQLYPHVPVVSNDLRRFMEKALGYFARRGRRRVALITTPRPPEMEKGMEDHFRLAMADRGQAVVPYWCLPIHSQAAEGARRCAQLLMDSGSDKRPDAMIIGDDNLVEETAAGLIAAGVRIPEDLEVVSLCNYPWAGSHVLPFTWLGFDTRQELRVCLEIIDRQRRGETAPAQTMIPPYFEEEVERSEGSLASPGPTGIVERPVPAATIKPNGGD